MAKDTHHMKLKQRMDKQVISKICTKVGVTKSGATTLLGEWCCPNPLDVKK